MTVPRNKPVTRPQPVQPFYNLEELRLFERFNRDTYMRKTGEQAKPWIKDKRIKRWFDTSPIEEGVVLDEMVECKYFDPDTQKMKKFYLTAAEMAEVNLPGTVVYSKYNPTPTTAAVVGPNGERTPLDSTSICSAEEAELIRAELGGKSTFVTADFMIGPYHYDWGSETRRPWQVALEKSEHSVPALLVSKYLYGVGAPGSWKLEGPGPIWVTAEPQDTGERDLRPEIPIPTRDLLPKEKVYKNLFATLIFRTNMTSEYNPAPPPLSTDTKYLEQLIRDGFARVLGAIAPK